MNDVTMQLEVAAGVDPLRLEHLTKDLKDTLANDDAILATGLVVSLADREVAAAGTKGTVAEVIAVLVAGAPYARPAADALIGAVQSWCARDRRTSVTVRDGDRSVEIVGSPTRRQAELLEQFWHGDDSDQPGPGDSTL